MKLALIAAPFVAVAAILAVAFIGHAEQAAQGQNVWCEAVQPGAQYESNSVRYVLTYATPGTSPAQACASLDSWQTFVVSTAP